VQAGVPLKSSTYALGMARGGGLNGDLLGSLFERLATRRPVELPSQAAKIAPMTGLDHVDLLNILGLDLDTIDVEEVISLIADQSAEFDTRQKAIAVAAELLAPTDDEELAWDETDQRIVAELLKVASDEGETPWLQGAAGDTLGLAWMWRQEFDRAAFLTMTPEAQHAARKVIGQDYNDWIESIPPPH
jgi:hypothetical protein